MSISIRSSLEEALSALDEAKKEVATAEHHLEGLLSELAVLPRAEKTSVSATVEAALVRLRSGRSRVAVAETTLAGVKTLP
ncbi:MAG: hypothetical protein K0S65_292 [Labilithrix sp.]|nr:hypothetical protein [Labilithrix sp.]